MTTNAQPRPAAMLRAGQIVRSGSDIYSVLYVNECRARVAPITRDGRVLKAEAENIAPDACVEIVADLEAAWDRIELAAAEAELADVRRELSRRDVPPKAAEPPRPPRVSRAPSIGGWRAVGTPPLFKDGSLAACVMAWIVANPGHDTKAIVAGVAADGAVAACVSRFHQAGLIEKS